MNIAWSIGKYIVSYVGADKSYIGDTKSYVGDT